MEADNLVAGVDQQPSLNLSGEEKIAIIAFLNTLTDETFLNDPRFSDPRAERNE